MKQLALVLLVGASVFAAPQAKKVKKNSKPVPIVKQNAEPTPPPPPPDPPKPKITKEQVMAKSVLNNLSPENILMLENASTPLVTAKLLIAMHKQVMGRVDQGIRGLDDKIAYYQRCLDDGVPPHDVEVYVGLYDGGQTRRNKLVGAVNRKINLVREEIRIRQESQNIGNSAIQQIEDLQKKIEAETTQP